MFAIDKRFGMMILLLGIIEYNCSVSAVEVCMCVMYGAYGVWS